MKQSTTRRALAGALAVTLATSAAPLLAQTPMYAPVPDAMMENGIKYLAGGVGLGARDAMHAAAGEYNLRLSFAEGRDAHYVPDVRVTVRSVEGRAVLDVANGGPLFYAQLPEGSYRVTVTHDGRARHRDVTIGDAPVTANFHWEGAARG